MSDPFSPIEWREEENNVEYFKPCAKLELKPRMRVSALLSQTQEPVKPDKGRLSLPGGLSRVSIFSQTTSASTTLEESFVSLQSASSVSKLSAFDIFSNSEVKQPDDNNMLCALNQTLSRSLKQVTKEERIATTVYEEECESGDDDSINNRGSELEEVTVSNGTALADKQPSELS